MIPTDNIVKSKKGNTKTQWKLHSSGGSSFQSLLRVQVRNLNKHQQRNGRGLVRDWSLVFSNFTD